MSIFLILVPMFIPEVQGAQVDALAAENEPAEKVARREQRTFLIFRLLA